MKGKGRVIYQRGLEKHFDLHSPPPPRPLWAVQNESLSLLAAPPNPLPTSPFPALGRVGRLQAGLLT